MVYATCYILHSSLDKRVHILLVLIHILNRFYHEYYPIYFNIYIPLMYFGVYIYQPSFSLYFGMSSTDVFSHMYVSIQMILITITFWFLAGQLAIGTCYWDLAIP